MTLDFNITDEWKHRGIKAFEKRINLSSLGFPKSVYDKLESDRQDWNRGGNVSVQIPPLPAFDIEKDNVWDFEWAWEAKDKRTLMRMLQQYYMRCHEIDIAKLVVRSWWSDTISQYRSMDNFQWVKFTRDLTQPAEEYYNEDSCWWSSGNHSRLYLYHFGGVGCLLYDGYGDLAGRVWLLPYKEKGIVAFNPYGINLRQTGEILGSLFSSLTGKTYQKSFEDFDISDMYINGAEILLFRTGEDGRYFDDGFLDEDIIEIKNLIKNSPTAIVETKFGSIFTQSLMELPFSTRNAEDILRMTIVSSPTLAYNLSHFYNFSAANNLEEAILNKFKFMAENGKMSSKFKQFLWAVFNQHYGIDLTNLRPKHIRKLIIFYEAIFNNRLTKFGRRFVEGSVSKRHLENAQRLTSTFGIISKQQRIDAAIEELGDLNSRMFNLSPLEINRRNRLQIALRQYKQLA